MKNRGYVLTDMGIVCALGADAETVWRRLQAKDASGMKRLDGLSGGESTVFGFAEGLPCPASVGERCALPVPRVGAIVDAAMVQIAAETMGMDMADVDIVVGDTDITIPAGESGLKAAKTMGKHQVRRLPVTEGGHLIGMLSQADLALGADQSEEAAQAFREVFEQYDPME